MFTRAPSASTVEAQPPTDALASTTVVRTPARARYAAQTSPLWPAPTTIASTAASTSPRRPGAVEPGSVGAGTDLLQADRRVDELVGDQVGPLQVGRRVLRREHGQGLGDEVGQTGLVEVAERTVGSVAHEAEVELGLHRVLGDLVAVDPEVLVLRDRLDDEGVGLARVRDVVD